ncbi:MAG: lysostaphin resistance A-like protein [Planctomycetota bacterium]
MRSNGPMIAMAVVYGLLGAAGALWMRGEGFDPWPEGGLAPGALLTAVGIGLAAGVVLHVAYRPFRGRASVQPLERAVTEAAATIGYGNLMALMPGAVLAEEVFFRGAMQPAFAYGFPLLGLAVASVAFGFAHFIPPRREFWMYPVLASVAGAIFGACWLVTGGHLLSAFAAHLTVNVLNLRLMRDTIAAAAADIELERDEPSGDIDADADIDLDER